jgi:hypothetical protein
MSPLARLLKQVPFRIPVLFLLGQLMAALTGLYGADADTLPLF